MSELDKTFWASIVFLLMSVMTYAQPGRPDPPKGGCQNPPCNPVPMEGEDILLILGIILGTGTILYRYWQVNKTKTSTY